MKKLLLVLIMFPFITIAQYDSFNDLERKGYKAKVKSIIKVDYSYLDSLGGLLLENSRIESKYDSYGNNIEWIYYELDKLHTNSSKNTYKYDSFANKIEELYYRPTNILESRTVYKYNSNGNIIEENRYKPNGELEWKYLYKYDLDGNMVERTCYRSYGDLSTNDYDRKYIAKYDSIGNKIMALSYLTGEKLDWYFTSIYDSSGQLSEFSEFSGDGTLYGRSTYKYNYEEEIIESEVFYDEGNEFFSKSVYKSDSHGNIIEESIYNPDGEYTCKYLYEYDSHGNIIKNSRFKGKYLIPQSITEYIFEYYE